MYTQLACNNVYGHDVYDHTETPATLALDATHSPYTPFYLSLDPAGPHLDMSSLNLSSMYPITAGRSHTPQPSDSYIIFADGNEDDEDEPDPRMEPSKRCLADPAVQSGAARIQTMMTTVMGALSALTTGWWGHFGEQHGRMKVLAVATLGLFLTYACVSLSTLLRTNALPIAISLLSLSRRRTARSRPTGTSSL